MDLINHIPGVGPTGLFNPGATTPAPFNVPQTGAVDGTGPGTATKNMAELYNRDLLWRRALISAAGLAFDPTNWVQEVAALNALIASATTTIGSFGQCQLTKSGANILLLPKNGNKLSINGAVQTVPAAGVSLAPAGLVAGTLYYVYAYMVGAVMTLEASATVRKTNAATGVEVKLGDATRTLVGMVRPVAGPLFADSAAQRFVLSWFNRRALYGAAAFTTARSTGSITVAEVHSEIRNEYLTWGDALVVSEYTGSGFVAGGLPVSTFFGVHIGFDGAVTRSAGQGRVPGVEYNTLPHHISDSRYLAEGYHYGTLLAAWLSGGPSFTFNGNSTGSDSNSLQTTIQG